MKNLLRQSTRNSAHLQFWKENPALLASLSILIGTATPLFFEHYLWSILFAGYLFFCQSKANIVLLLSSIAYGFLQQLPPSDKEASGIFKPYALLPHTTPFQKELQYKGILNDRIPCTIYYRQNQEQRPAANKTYFVRGELQQRGPADYVLKTKEWKEYSSNWCFAELRYTTKEKFKEFLSSKFSSKVAKFLKSLTTGDVEDRSIRYEFSRVGLQHILAISGFHFGILIAFLTFFLRLFLTKTWRIFTLFIITTAYYILIGPSPAVERSYLTALFYLIGLWANLRTSGLNLLGVALGIEIIFNPYLSSNLGFQLSFLSCFAILMFYSPIEQFMRHLSIQRNWSEVLKLSLLSRHGYLAASFFRKAISLNFAVNLVLLPVILFHFQQFPILGLLYNIFFPFCIGGSLFLLLSGLVFQVLFPPVANLLFWITDCWTDFLLRLVFNPPLAIDFSLKVSSIPVNIIIFYLLSLSFLRIAMRRETVLF
jgi:competence protein ComEC